MSDDNYVTRTEFDMLREQVKANLARLDSIDQSGTRGVGIVQQQLIDLKSDVTELGLRIQKHDEVHASDSKDRRTTRRWIITTIVAILVFLETPMLYIVAHVR